MKTNVTVVSAFFDIGRGDFNIIRCAPRSAQKYIEYFDFWARIQNDLVVYTTSEYKDIVLQIRKKYGRENQTVVIEVNNIFEIETYIYQKMKEIENNEDFKNFRFWNKEVSNKADYDYIMLMKYWCMADAVHRNLVSDIVFWMDFGYNHGGECYTNPTEFDFELKGNNIKQIQLYALPGKTPSMSHSASSLQYQFDTICGCQVVVPSELCSQLWELTKGAMLSLISLDCIDDDQQLLLMSYKLYPELFEVYNSDWFMPIKEYWGGNQLNVKNKCVKVKKKCSLLRRILSKIKRLFFPSQKDNFVNRIKLIMDKYY